MDAKILEKLKWIQEKRIDEAIKDFESLEEERLCNNGSPEEYLRNQDSNIIDLLQTKRILNEIDTEAEDAEDAELSGKIKPIVDYIEAIPCLGSATKDNFLWLKEKIEGLIG